MADTDTRPSSTDNEPGLWASPKMVGSAALISLIVLVGIMLAVLGPSGDEPAPQPVPSSTPPTSATPAAVGDPSVCGLKDVQLTGTVATAPATTWSLVGTVAAPTVDGAGPGIQKPSGFRACYAHTPLGAVLSSTNYLITASHPASRRETVERMAAPGPGRDRALAGLSQANDAPTDTRVQVAGFRVVSYTGEQATVDVALRVVTDANASLMSQVVDLVWVAGDWKVRASDDANFLTPVRPIADLGGYVPWSGA